MTILVSRHEHDSVIQRSRQVVKLKMDSQSNALYDNPSFPKFGLSELSFNAQKGKGDASKTGNVQTPPQVTSPSGRKFLIVQASTSKSPESSTSPFLSPSSSFVKSKQHHSMKSLKLGEFLMS